MTSIYERRYQTTRNAQSPLKHSKNETCEVALHAKSLSQRPRQPTAASSIQSRYYAHFISSKTISKVNEPTIRPNAVIATKYLFVPSLKFHAQIIFEE